VSRSDGVLVETLEGMSASGRALSREAIGALQDLADRRAVELLVLTLRQADPGTRGAAADALSALGSHAAAPLLEAFEHDPEVRRRCGGLVARVAGPAALPALLRTFQSPFESERRSAADGLAQLGASALPPLRARLPHTDPDHRALILGILGRSGSPETLDAILVGAGDTDPSVRVAAIQALTAFDTPKATGALSAAARSPNWRIRRAAVAALGHRGWQNHEAARMLGNAIRDVNPHVRTAAAEALGRLASGFTLTDIEPFVEALRHGDEVARTRARATLEALRGALAFNIAVPRLNSPEGAAMALGIERELRAHVDLAEYDMVVSEFRQVVPDLPARDVEVGRQHQQSAQGSITDAVRFSVLSPFTTMRGRPCLIDVWAHTGDLDAVLRDMRHHPAWRPGVNVRSKGPMDVSRGTTLSARIAVPTLGWADDDTVTWGGAAGNATYAFVVPADATHGEHAGHLHVHVGGIQLARVTFLITVGDTDADAQDVTVSQRIVHSAFASYASEDRDRVLARIQGMQQVARDLDIFVDVVSLRSGERWEERLESEILDRDVLYLFWSRAASASPWVDREWRTAYRAKGLDGIEPVPIEPPDVSPPPLELSSLHFNDWTLEVRRRADT
jgi:HEAT repeat protein